MSITEEIAFSIISLAGDGRASLTQALAAARKGDFGQAEALVQEADEKLLEAHRKQTEELLKKEAEGSLKDPFNVLIAHAQDYVMTGVVMKEMTAEIINLYLQLKAK
jgi:cellobiose-specific phosphotransferase system component IIA